MSKYQLNCKKCGHVIANMKEWFESSQKCPVCGSNHALVSYSASPEGVKQLIDANLAQSVFDYFDFLPLDDKQNIVTSGEGVIPVENWTFLEEYAKTYHQIECKVHVYRNDLNPGTGTFKDVAASVAASVLKENRITHFAIASTGNIATAFSYYLAKAGISLAVFIPQDALLANEAEISSYGQKVFRVKGDYAYAKKLAAEYAKKHNILISGGNIDPMRVEAKKTMVFEWIRQMDEFPTVYVQALSGGTGPIAIDKALDDIKSLNLVNHYPRYIMVQPSACNPMTLGWENAKANGFPEGWLNDYPIIDAPQTKVPTLATGNPATFPIIAELVKKSGGEMITFDESKMIDVARLTAYEKNVRIGPASSIALGGFFESLKQGIIKNGDVVLVNIGEGVRRAPEFMEEMIYTTEHVSSSEECNPHHIEQYKEELYDALNR
ncbi:MAG: pyridoxal-phosphate dependent enzyme [Bacteroidales bacterium]|nr:pyridoxal-phosphate dependent enzyme [Bacteroidales bacterium]